ncbi:MAG: UDP-N-acetylglucosamine--N-acetylmuramyl-(pentapeptide) pyrophosphoryl-undecaprenol N-acetylglucosamine transferase [Planctomycetes bacterium]|nr:UDP-N-acetylglucosamine--N-acetylmuramyl-(pentapeptide) pyrophosphoryl-undecaprenol N-acetylglucosamine transferase [Planctomycetota bacterium]
MSRILLCGGGTGGHIAPALAVGRELASRGHAIGYVTLGRAIEERFASEGAQRYTLSAERPGERRCRRLRLLLRLPKVLAETRRILDDFRPEVVVGTGGLAAFFPLRAALRQRLPTALLEVNARAGRVTRTLARKVGAVLCGFESSAEELASRGARARAIGVPIRAGFGSAAREAARAHFGFPPTGRVIAVLGGSQGASGVNRIAAELAPGWLAAGHHLVHAAGATDAARYAEQARALAGPGSWRVVEFLPEVDLLLAAADLVVARAGASTVAEIAASGRAAVLVPYPHHADQHQLANARSLGEGALLAEESAWGPELRARISALIDQPAELERMASANRRCARTDAARHAAREIEALITG